MKNSQDLQHLFDTDIESLLQSDEDSIQFISQSHCGDLLIEEVNYGNERFRLWRNLDCNGGGIEIEFYGKMNQYTWETICTEFPAE